MTMQRGKDILLKLEDPAGSSTFVSMAGLRARTISLNAKTVDTTNADSVGAWRELLPGSGVKSLSVSGSGVFTDTAADVAIRSVFFAQEARRWQLVIPAFGILDGVMQIAALEYAGDFDGEAVYSLTLASAGNISFTPI
ncbi:MAG: phage major tail protein, TP901-1 family [Robiginitomaculum sp.]|nr:phage major tail protein, TP901-1 family [Robiginitomaculum sp.]MDQ7077309.1 phage major tail protein, TP901-1 family [Robiginitomaculum sp.]